MLKLRHLFEVHDKFIDEFYRCKEQMQMEWDSGQKHQSWRLIPKNLLKRTWNEFVKYGRVNERNLDKIWEILSEDITKIGINSDIRDGNDVEIFGKEHYDEVTEEEWKRFFNFISDQGDRVGYGRGGDWDVEKGHARYSDRSRSLFKMADVVEKAPTPEEKLIAIDQILNFVHGIGGMAKWFVEGGDQSLIDIRDAEVKGIHLTGKLSEGIPAIIAGPAFAGLDPPIQTITEESVAGKNFIVVDIQPEYKGSIFFLPEFVKFINTHYEEMNRLVFLYNGQETLGMIDESSYRMWWIEQGIEENIIDQADFYDKGYAFFRYCMDASSASPETIANFVRFIYENNINDSREMNRDMWAKYLREYRKTDRKEIYDLLRHADDCVHVPDLMDYIRRFNNVMLCGGGVNECLKEVEIALLALKKPYSVEHRFTY